VLAWTKVSPWRAHENSAVLLMLLQSSGISCNISNVINNYFQFKIHWYRDLMIFRVSWGSLVQGYISMCRFSPVWNWISVLYCHKNESWANLPWGKLQTFLLLITEFCGLKRYKKHCFNVSIPTFQVQEKLAEVVYEDRLPNCVWKFCWCLQFEVFKRQ